MELILRGMRGSGAPAALELRDMSGPFNWGMVCEGGKKAAIIEYTEERWRHC